MPKKVRFDSKVRVRKIPSVDPDPHDLCDTGGHSHYQTTRSMNQRFCTTPCTSAQCRALPPIPFSLTSGSCGREIMMLPPLRFPLQFLSIPTATDDRWEPTSSPLSNDLSSSIRTSNSPPLPQQRKPSIEHMDCLLGPPVLDRRHQGSSCVGVRNAVFQPEENPVARVSTPSEEVTIAQEQAKDSKLLNGDSSLTILSTTTQSAPKRTRRIQTSFSMPLLCRREGAFGTKAVRTQGHQNTPLKVEKSGRRVLNRSSSLPLRLPNLCGQSSNPSNSNQIKDIETPVATTLSFCFHSTPLQPRPDTSVEQYASKPKKSSRHRSGSPTSRCSGDSPPVMPIRREFTGSRVLL